MGRMLKGAARLECLHEHSSAGIDADGPVVAAGIAMTAKGEFIAMDFTSRPTEFIDQNMRYPFRPLQQVDAKVFGTTKHLDS